MAINYNIICILLLLQLVQKPETVRAHLPHISLLGQDEVLGEKFLVLPVKLNHALASHKH